MKNENLSIVNFELLNKPEVKANAEKLQAEIDNIRKVEKEMISNLRLQQNNLQKQITAVEENTYLKTNELKTANKEAVAYDEQKYVKILFDEKIAKLKTIFGELNFKATKGGKVVLLFDEVYVIADDWNTLVFNNERSCSFPVDKNNIEENLQKLNTAVTFMKNIDSEIAVAFEKLKTEIDEKIIAEKVCNTYAVLLYKSNDYFFVKQYSLKIFETSVNFRLDSNCFTKSYVSEKVATKRFNELVGGK